MVSANRVGVIVLAAGMGKRMQSPLPKVLHPLGGKPLLFHVLSQVKRTLPSASVGIIVGHGRVEVEAFVRREPSLKGMDFHFIVQEKQLGTGHAIQCAMNSPWGVEKTRSCPHFLVLPGDLPLITQEMLEPMVVSLKKGEAMRLLTCTLENPTSYGRIIRKGIRGSVLRIVEEKDCTAKEKKIQEVATSIYLFETQFLQEGLKRLSNQNAQREYYLTDLVAHAAKKKKKNTVLTWSNSEELRGVNDLWELAQVSALLNERILRKWALQGVTFMDPRTTQVEVGVYLEAGITVHPGVILRGETSIGAGSVIGPRVVLDRVIVGRNVQLKTGTVAEQSQIEAHAQVGPFAHLRPESHVGKGAKIGNFVELKKTQVGEKTSIAHLSYLGDAVVGSGVNIGCGFVTCNYDGRIIDGARKHRTVIDDDAFIGSDCQAVAPVRIGQGAYVASGSTITEDVPPGALAIARSRQINKLGYVKKEILCAES